MRAHLIALALAGCTASSLDVTGTPVGCDVLGGEVDGVITDPVGALTAFGPIQASLSMPDQITLTDGVLSLVIDIADTPREISLVFPGRPVFSENGKLVLDQDTACYAGRFVAFFQYHGQISGWFAAPIPSSP